MKLEGNRVLVTGSKGTLGSKIAPLLISKGAIVRSPLHAEMDITDVIACHYMMAEFQPDIVFHAAAYTDVPKAELPKFRQKVVYTNIVGTDNVRDCAHHIGAKTIYISTDYVYEGDSGHYEVGDPTGPRTFYGFSKLAGESSMGKKDLIIRTSFAKRGTWGPAKRQLQNVFKGVYTSKDWVDIIAPLIVDSLGKTGIINIGTERKTLHSLAVQDYKDVCTISPSTVNLGYEYPKDSSMKLSI